MKLLFDEHFSFRTVRALLDIFPEAKHVSFFNLDRRPDETIWQFAILEGFTIVTKDDDFHQRSLTLGQPPKIIWLKLPNGSNKELEEFIRSRAKTMINFACEGEEALLLLKRREKDNR